MTDTDDTAHTWRDLTHELTPAQVTTLDRIEADLVARGAPADKVAAALLDHARYHAQHNLADTAMFGHLPTPAVTRFLNPLPTEQHRKLVAPRRRRHPGRR